MSRRGRVAHVEHRFVEFVPAELEPNTLYISMEYGTVVYNCFCGCGNRVVTPLTPSHYWIEHSRVHWGGRWSKEKIEANRRHDLTVKELFFTGRPVDQVEEHADEQRTPDTAVAPGRWSRLARFIRRR